MKKLARLLLLAFCFAVTSIAAQSQVGLYGQLNLTYDSYNSAAKSGLTGGLYGNVFKHELLRIGLDARGAYDRGDQYDYRSFAIGPRIQVKPPVISISPYIEGVVGIGGARYTGSSALPTHYSNKFQYGVVAGLDRTMLPHLDWRILEVEYLRMSAFSSGPAAQPTNVVTVGTGIVIRLP